MGMAKKYDSRVESSGDQKTFLPKKLKPVVVCVELGEEVKPVSLSSVLFWMYMKVELTLVATSWVLVKETDAASVEQIRLKWRWDTVLQVTLVNDDFPGGAFLPAYARPES